MCFVGHGCDKGSEHVLDGLGCLKHFRDVLFHQDHKTTPDGFLRKAIRFGFAVVEAVFGAEIVAREVSSPTGEFILSCLAATRAPMISSTNGDDARPMRVRPAADLSINAIRRYVPGKLERGERRLMQFTKFMSEKSRAMRL